MKQLHYEINIDKNQKNPKKTWELLKEISTGTKTTHNIDKLIVNDNVLYDNLEMANEFNNFFTNIGQSINQQLKKPKIIKLKTPTYVTWNLHRSDHLQ